MPEHIRRHSAQVARVATRLGKALHERGERVDIALVVAAALLHDIAKAPCLVSRLDHATEGGRILRELGLESVAALVERHVYLGDWDPDGAVTGAEIVNYADKRVLYEEVVSLDVRYRDLVERYGRGRREIEERIRGNWAVMTRVEAKIFGRLAIGPADLLARRPRDRGGRR